MGGGPSAQFRGGHATKLEKGYCTQPQWLEWVPDVTPISLYDTLEYSLTFWNIFQGFQFAYEVSMGPSKLMNL